MMRSQAPISLALLLLGACGHNIEANYIDSGETDGEADADTDADSDADTDADADADAELTDYCHLQWPCATSLAAGAASETIYGVVYEEGVTPGQGQGPGLSAEVGVGPDGSDPSGNGDWTWTKASYFGDKDGMSEGDLSNDEYAASFSAPSAAGSYDFAYRFSIDGGSTWRYCDAGGDAGGECEGLGSDDGYGESDAGQLTVE